MANIEFIEQIRKQLLLWRVNDFAILTHDLAFDLDQCLFKDAYLKAFNKVYWNIDFSKTNFREARMQFNRSAGYSNGAVDWMLSNYSVCDGISVLDVGPGSGVSSLLYKELFGAALSWINLENPPSRHKTPSQQQELIRSEKIDVQYGYLGIDDFSGVYDVILMTEVLEHIPYNPESVMEKIYRMLKIGGHLILTTPCKKGAGLPYFSSWRDLPLPGRGGSVLDITMGNHVYEYAPEEVEEILDVLKFKIIYRNIGKSESSGMLFICTK